jgi:quercetin dioxygenase-like cupin family protein
MTITDVAPTGLSDTVHIPSLAEELLAAARGGGNGRAARTLTSGAGLPLKQTLIALDEGVSLTEHSCAGAATLQVLRGRVCLSVGEEHLELDTGAHVSIPSARHSLHCLDEAVLLLTVANSAGAAPVSPR